MKHDRIPVFDINTFTRALFRNQGKQNHLWPQDLTGHFEISRRCIGHPRMEAHRLDFYLVFLITAGGGMHSFGLKEHYIRENMLCFAGPEMITAWQPEAEEQRGFLCAFSHEFFSVGLENKELLQQVPFFRIDGESVIHLTDEQMQDYLLLFELMHIEYEKRTSHSSPILRSALQLLIYKANALYKAGECEPDVPNRSALRLLRTFTSLYQEDFKPLKEGNPIQLKKVSDYAKLLNVTQNHLNDTIKAVTGKSAGQLIREQQIKQATMCLLQGSKNINEVAYLLGYDDPSYFARYYKKQTGIPPSTLKKHNL